MVRSISENLPVGSLSNLLKDLGRAKPKKCCERDVNYINLKNIRKLLQYYKGKVSREKRIRIKAEIKAENLKRRLNQLKNELAEKYLIDEATLLYIEKCLERIPLLENICKTIYNEKIANFKDTFREVGDTAFATDAHKSLCEQSKSRPLMPLGHHMRATDSWNDRNKKRHKRESRSELSTTCFTSESQRQTPQEEKYDCDNNCYTELKKRSSRSRSSGSEKQVTGEEPTHNTEKRLNSKLAVKNKDKEDSIISYEIDSDHFKTSLMYFQMEVDAYKGKTNCHNDLNTRGENSIATSKAESKFNNHTSTSNSFGSEKGFNAAVESTEHGTKVSNNVSSPQNNDKKPFEETIEVSMESLHKTEDLNNQEVYEAKNIASNGTIDSASQELNHPINPTEEIDHSHQEKVPWTSIKNTPSQDASMTKHSRNFQNDNLEMASTNMNNVPANHKANNLLPNEADSSEKRNQQNLFRYESNAVLTKLQPITSKGNLPKINVSMEPHASIGNDDVIDNIFDLPPTREMYEAKILLFENQRSSQNEPPSMEIEEGAPASKKRSPKESFNNNESNTKSSELLPINVKDGDGKEMDVNLQFHDKLEADKTGTNSSDSFGDEDNHNLLPDEAVTTEYRDCTIVKIKSNATLETGKQQFTGISETKHTRDGFKSENSFIRHQENEIKQLSMAPSLMGDGVSCSSSSIEEEIEAPIGTDSYSSIV